MSQILLDECINRCFRFKARVGQKAVRSVRVLGCGATDDKIAEHAEQHNYHVLTADKRFVLDLFHKSRTVYYVEMKTGKLYHISIKKLADSSQRKTS
jgi:predicted nuclease of predicted toxin-antitoxin system